jgi:ketosteroid isomerase-like protein
MKRLAYVCVLAAGFACAGAAPSTKKEAATGGIPRWMEGDWSSADGKATEHWHAAGGALFGVGFPARGPAFEVMIVQPTNDGKLRFTAWPGGDGGVPFDESARGASNVVFANPTHDFPREIGYSRDGDALSAFIGPGGGERAESYGWTLASSTSAPMLEQADLDFAADTLTSLSAGWASWFDEEGAQWRPQRGRIVGPEAIRELMRPAFDENGLKLEWTPRASGLAPSGDLGFTIGDYVATTKTGERSTGGYVTIWRKQADGSWKVLFDVGT